jgi:hypothetical protein
MPQGGSSTKSPSLELCGIRCTVGLTKTASSSTRNACNDALTQGSRSNDVPQCFQCSPAAKSELKTQFCPGPLPFSFFPSAPTPNHDGHVIARRVVFEASSTARPGSRAWLKGKDLTFQPALRLLMQIRATCHHYISGVGGLTIRRR